jgi:DNA-binding transcriptional LysR family regulator
MCLAGKPLHSIAEISTSALRVHLPPIASSSYESRLLFREPLVVAFPKTRKVKEKRIRIADLAGERIVTFQRASSPEVFDTIIRVCNDNGFSPRPHSELNNMHSVLSTVEAGEGVALVSASARNLRGQRRLLPAATRRRPHRLCRRMAQEGTFDRPQIVRRTAR